MEEATQIDLKGYRNIRGREAWEGVLGQGFVCLFSIPPGAGQIRSRPSFFLLGTGWHQPAPKQLFQHQWGKPDGHPNRGRPGNEVICFPYSAGKLLPQGKAI